MDFGKSYSNAIKSLWDAKCTIYQLTDNKANGSSFTKQTWTATDTDIPCRVSFSGNQIALSSDNAFKEAQEITLFIGKDVDLPTGSKITVTQNGVTASYETSGVPAVYSVHKEIKLKKVDDWA